LLDLFWVLQIGIVLHGTVPDERHIVFGKPAVSFGFFPLQAPKPVGTL
jgi:hypothetical protein